MSRAAQRSPWAVVATLAATVTTAVAACGGTAAPPQAPVADAGVGAADLVIRDVRLFDGDRVTEGATVVVRDGRVAAVGAGLEVAAAAEVVDGAGMTLLPGLIDAHTHTFAASALEASLAFGVTTVLDMFTSPEPVRVWREEQAAGRASGRADIFSAGLVATAAGGHGTQYGMPIPTVDSPGDAAGFVADRVAEGSDYLKIIIEDGSSIGRRIPSLDAERVAALVEAADEQGLLSVVHVGVLEGARTALNAGADGLVHIWVDRTPSPALATRIREAGMFVVPTFTVLENIGGPAGGASFAADPRIAPFLDPDAARSLGMALRGSPDMPAQFDSAVAALRALHEAGVTILAGTDAPNPGTTHGASMHRELELLVEAGLSPLEALRAATSSTADAFGLADRGRIRPGARADLVLVSGDPTADIRATRAIRRIWKAGVPFDRDDYGTRMAAVRAERAAAEAASARGPGPISDFDDRTLDAAFGIGWGRTTDERMGGTSTVTLDFRPAGDGLALRARGETKAGVPYPYAGAMLVPGDGPMRPTNLSGADALAFRARGDGQTYQVLLFHEKGGMAPAIHDFTAGSEWEEHVVPWSAFGDVDGRGIMAIAIVAGGVARSFEFWIDDVELR